MCSKFLEILEAFLTCRARKCKWSQSAVSFNLSLIISINEASPNFKLFYSLLQQVTNKSDGFVTARWVRRFSRNTENNLYRSISYRIPFSLHPVYSTTLSRAIKRSRVAVISDKTSPNGRLVLPLADKKKKKRKKERKKERRERIGHMDIVEIVIEVIGT